MMRLLGLEAMDAICQDPDLFIYHIPQQGSMFMTNAWSPHLCLNLTLAKKSNTEKDPVFSPLSSMLGAEQISSEELRVYTQSGEAHPQVTSE